MKLKDLNSQFLRLRLSHVLPYDVNWVKVGLIVSIILSNQLFCCRAIKLDDFSRFHEDEDTDEEGSEEIVYTAEEMENIVGFGEDCSNEGPFCDGRQHLACDKEEEICVCDDKNGYVHVGDLESSEIINDVDELGIFDDMVEDELESLSSTKKICIKSTTLETKLDRLMNITKKIRDFTDIFKKYRKYLPKKYQDLLKDEL